MLSIEDYTGINIDEYTNAELEEMGIPLPCACWNAVKKSYWVECPDCGYYEELPEARIRIW